MDDNSDSATRVHLRWCLPFPLSNLRALDVAIACPTACSNSDAAAAFNAVAGEGSLLHAMPGSVADVVAVATICPANAGAMQKVIACLSTAMKRLDGTPVALRPRQGSAWRPCTSDEAERAVCEQSSVGLNSIVPPAWRAMRMSEANAGSATCTRRLNGLTPNSLCLLTVDHGCDARTRTVLEAELDVCAIRYKLPRLPAGAIQHVISTGQSVALNTPQNCVVLPAAIDAILVALHPGWAADVRTACIYWDYPQLSEREEASVHGIVCEAVLPSIQGGGSSNILVPLAFVSGPGGGRAPAGVHVAEQQALALGEVMRQSCRLFGGAHLGEVSVVVPELADRKKRDRVAFEESGGWKAWGPEEEGGTPLRGASHQETHVFRSALEAPPPSTAIPSGMCFPAEKEEAGNEADEHPLPNEPSPPSALSLLMRPGTIHMDPEAEASPAPSPPPPSGPVLSKPAIGAVGPLMRPAFGSFNKAASASILPSARGGAIGTAPKKTAVKPSAASVAAKAKPTNQEGGVTAPVARVRAPPPEIDPVANDAYVRQCASAGGMTQLAKLTLPQCKAFIRHNAVPGGLGGNKAALLERIAKALGVATAEAAVEALPP